MQVTNFHPKKYWEKNSPVQHQISCQNIRHQNFLSKHQKWNTGLIYCLSCKPQTTLKACLLRHNKNIGFKPARRSRCI